MNQVVGNELLVGDSPTPSIPQISGLLESMHGVLVRNFLDTTKLPVLKKENIAEARLRLMRVRFVRYRKPEDVLRAITSFITTAFHLQVPVVYILSSNVEGVELYFGLYRLPEMSEDTLEDTFQTLLNALPGFLPGCEIVRLNEGKKDLLAKISNLKFRRLVTGIPSSKEQQENRSSMEASVQGVEQLVDAISDTFALITYAQPLMGHEIEHIEDQVSAWHDLVHKFVKVADQLSLSQQTSNSKSQGKTHGTQDTMSTGKVDGVTITTQRNMLHRWEQGIGAFAKGGERPLKQESSQSSIQKSHGTSDTESTTESWQTGSSASRSVTFEHTSKQALYVEELLGRLHKRLDEGVGFGMWRTVTEIFSDKEPHAVQASNILAGLLSGKTTSLDPIRIVEVDPISYPFNALDVMLMPDHPLGIDYGGLSTLLTSAELSLITKLPVHELSGVAVEKLTDYGRSQPVSVDAEGIHLGKLIDRERITGHFVGISTAQLQRHCFVTGATGSGKSNSVRHLLKNLWLRKLPIPFLVIEPVKREYRYLKNQIGDDLQVFTLGEGDCDFSLNPFDFDPIIGLIPHIDLLKAAFNASLGMYSSMPFIMEDIIYQIYQQHGWNIETGENIFLERAANILGKVPIGGLRDMFLPCLGDMIPLVEESISKFFPAMTDYGGSLTGALRARLSSMTRGAKGTLLNRRQSIPFDELLSKPCVIELSAFTDNEEKSFIMALLLMKLYEYRQRCERLSEKVTDENLKHVLVIEEAHRLLSKPVAGGEHSAQGRQKGVEVFADILAEIRSYGQGIVVVDQIPSKLIPDVLRNTDVKIAHRLVDREDRQVLGATMNLDEEQLQDIARSNPGQATIYFGGLRKALRVQVTESSLPGINFVLTEPRMMVYRKVAAFGPTDKDIGTKITEKKKDVALAYSVCYLSLAICTNSEMLRSLRDQAIATMQQRLELEEPELVWPTLALAIHQMPGYLTSQNVNQDMATYLTCVGASVLRAWLLDESLTVPLSRLKGENIGLGLLEAAERKRSRDLLDLFIGIRLMGVRDSFQREIENHLRMNHKTALDGKEGFLWNHSKELVMQHNIPERVIIQLMLRHLLQFQTEDPQMQLLASTAFGKIERYLKSH